MSSPASLLTAAEVAGIMKVSVQTVYRWAKPGEPLEHATVRVGDVVRFRSDDVAALLGPDAVEPKAAS